MTANVLEEFEWPAELMDRGTYLAFVEDSSFVHFLVQLVQSRETGIDMIWTDRDVLQAACF